MENLDDEKSLKTSVFSTLLDHKVKGQYSFESTWCKGSVLWLW